METKVCSTCKVTKCVIDFGKNKRLKDGLHYSCKECAKISSAKVRSKEKSYTENKECTGCKLVLPRDRFTKNPSSKDGLHSKCKKCRTVVDQQYKEQNKEAVYGRTKEWMRKNRYWLKIYHKEYRKKRCEVDAVYKLKLNISSLIKLCFKNRGVIKNTKTEQILGISPENFINYLNNNPYGFLYTDLNMDLDHIIPVSSATTAEEVIRLNHYTNFQLLPSIYNRNIKGVNEFDREHFEDWLRENPC